VGFLNPPPFSQKPERAVSGLSNEIIAGAGDGVGDRGVAIWRDSSPRRPDAKTTLMTAPARAASDAKDALPRRA